MMLSLTAVAPHDRRACGGYRTCITLTMTLGTPGRAGLTCAGAATSRMKVSGEDHINSK